MALTLEFAPFLWCLVRRVNVFVINVLCLVIVIGAVLTLETDQCVLVTSAQHRLD
jgi:hypothetical protein